MHDDACVDFLQWCLPKLHKRWPGFRKVRKQVCKRIDRRRHALGLANSAAYRDYLAAHPAEWAVLDAMCRITISRFYRDRGGFDTLGEVVLPDLADAAAARGEAALRCWSAGCASGEEVYSLRILWAMCLQDRYPDLTIHITATDAGAHMLARARRGCYGAGSLKELPPAWVEAAFAQEEGAFCVRPAYREGLSWQQQDIRKTMPRGLFHLILCRNLIFTYFDEALQQACLERLLKHLHPGGVLVLGKHESLPNGAGGLTAWDEHRHLYRKQP